MEQVDPKLYGLPPRTVLMKQDSDEFVLVINRKSRIIMKDALTIVKKVEKIKEKVQGASVVLETSAPVCSKSIKFLKENGVDFLKSV
ncbi:MAG: hypothetical protein KAQ72_15190 [Desulfobacula sp.]|nr:hypothetical protein [Desulfobacula sp.]